MTYLEFLKTEIELLESKHESELSKEDLDLLRFFACELQLINEESLK